MSCSEELIKLIFPFRFRVMNLKKCIRFNNHKLSQFILSDNYSTQVFDTTREEAILTHSFVRW